MFSMKDYEFNFVQALDKENIYLFCENKSKKPFVIINHTDYNKEYVEENKLQTIQPSHAGGTLVLFPGDQAITWISSTSILTEVLDGIVKYFNSIDIKATLDGNDVMLDNNKLFGTMSYEIGNRYYEGMFLSYTIDIEIIKNVCTKEMKKVPLGLNDLNVNKKELNQIILDILKENNINEFGGEA